MGTLREISTPRQAEAPRPPPASPSLDAHAIHRILVCVDRSPFSESCVQHALAISKSLGSAITLLHVIEPPHERSGLHTTDVLDWEIARQEASVYLERLGKDGSRGEPGQTIDTKLEQGHPGERIAAVARELGADLTVLGGHGERGEAAWNLGSTVQQVVAVTRSSVLVARSTWGTSGEGSPKRILVPLDGSRRTESVLPTAVRIANAHHAELLLVFVVQEPVATGVLRAPKDIEVARDLAARLEASGKRYLATLGEQLVREGAAVRTMVIRCRDGKQCLLELSEREHSDLIVLSAHGSTCNPSMTFGGVTAHILMHSTVSLLVLQDLPDTELHGPEKNRRAPPLRATYPEGD
jgi:nucleotide-binding universal stress UspA family protein